MQETVDEQEAFSEKAVSNQHLAFSQRQNQDQNQGPFTAEDAENAEESKTLPRMDADGRGLEDQGRQVEWKATPELYRLDTAEGMEAYEASFRMKIVPRLGGERRPVQPGVEAEGKTPPLRAAVPEEHGAQVHANLG